MSASAAAVATKIGGGDAAEPTPFIAIIGLTKVFASLRGERVLALGHMSVDIRKGELLTVIGPGGYGKSTLLKQMNLEPQAIRQRSGKTVALITHSIPEAVFPGDRVFVMTARPGRLARVIPVATAHGRDLDVMSTPVFGAAAREVRACCTNAARRTDRSQAWIRHMDTP